MLQMIPPLEVARFDMAYRHFCASKRVKLSPRLLIINNRLVDLHALHTFVMREGGEAKVVLVSNLFYLVLICLQR